MKDVRRAEDISVAEAIARGVLDKSKQRYRNTVTGEVISLDQAVRRSEYTTPHQLILVAYQNTC